MRSTAFAVTAKPANASIFLARQIEGSVIPR
jgi:hypothetical protein